MTSNGRLSIKYYWISIKSTELISNILFESICVVILHWISTKCSLNDTKCWIPHAMPMVWCRPLLCFVLNLYPNVLDLSHGTVRYAPDNIRSTSRTTNPRQQDNTYASSTRQYNTYISRKESTHNFGKILASHNSNQVFGTLELLQIWGNSRP